MRKYSFLALGYFFTASVLLTLISCSSKEHRAGENILRADPKGLHYAKPIQEKELPIFDAKLAFFEFNKATLTKEAKAALIPTAQFLKQNPGVRLVVEGYCDERGSDEYNLKLGQRRADSVKKFLLRQGISKASVDTFSYGRIMGSGEKTRAQNRRVGFQIVYPKAE